MGIKKPDLILSFVGDVMLARDVQANIINSGPEYLFSEIVEILRGSDIVFGNLECPISQKGQPLRFKNVCLRADPVVIPTLNYGNFKVMSLANNHIYDYGKDALLDTIFYLQNSGIIPVGAGSNRDQANGSVIIDKNGFKLAFLAATRCCEATSHSPDQPQAAELDYRRIGNSIKLLKGRTDFIIVSLHTGIEYCECPSPEDYSSFLRLLEQGADIIIASHPHVLQGIYFKGGKLAAFSLGNFVFDNIYEAKGDNRIWQTGILRVFINDKTITRYEFIPVRIDITGKSYILEGEEKQSALENMDRLSSMLNYDYIQENFWKMAGKRTVSDTIPVLIRKFKEHGLVFLIQMIPRLRLRHFRFFLEWIRARLRNGYHRNARQTQKEI